MPGVPNWGEAAHKVVVVGDLLDRVAAADCNPCAQVAVNLDQANNLTIQVAVEIALRLVMGEVSCHCSWNDGPGGGKAGRQKPAVRLLVVLK